jgi:hypothetical protein
MIAIKTPYWLDSRPFADRTSCGDFIECFPLDLDLHAIVMAMSQAAAPLQAQRHARFARLLAAPSHPASR